MPEVLPEPAEHSARIRRIPAASYMFLFGAIRYAFTTGLDSDFKKIDDQLLDLLTFQQPDNQLSAMNRTLDELKERVEAKEAKLDDLIARLIVRCVELNIATDAEIAEIERARMGNDQRGSAT